MAIFLMRYSMKNELYRSSETLDVSIGDMTVSLFHITIGENDSTGEYTGSHFHTAYELQYVKRGSLTLVDEAESRVINEGEFVIIPPGTFHSNTQRSDFVRYTLRFSITANSGESDGFSEYCHYSRILGAISGITVLKDKTAEHDIGRLAQLELTQAENMHRIKLYTALLITDILQSAEKQQTRPATVTVIDRSVNMSTEDERIKFIIENCIQKYFATNQTADRIAKELSMSERNCARVVNRLLGDNISNIVIKQRMHIARTLIEKTDRSLGDIAEAVGYNTYVAFYTAFKKYYGISPTEIRT